MLQTYFAKVGYNLVGGALEKGCCLRVSRNSNDQAETASASRRNAGRGVLEHYSASWGTPRRRAASKNMSAAGFPIRPRRSRSKPSTWSSKNSVKRPARKMSLQRRLDEATAKRRPHLR